MSTVAALRPVVFVWGGEPYYAYVNPADGNVYLTADHDAAGTDTTIAPSGVLDVTMIAGRDGTLHVGYTERVGTEFKVTFASSPEGTVWTDW